MSTLDFDFDMQMSNLEREWRNGYEAGITARAEYQSLAAGAGIDAAKLQMARRRLDRAEALKARIMEKIERLESRLVERGPKRRGSKS